MNTANIVILFLLFISPFIYFPLVIKKRFRVQEGFLRYLIIFLFGLVQSISYLIILFVLGIPL